MDACQGVISPKCNQKPIRQRWKHWSGGSPLKQPRYTHCIIWCHASMREKCCFVTYMTRPEGMVRRRPLYCTPTEGAGSRSTILVICYIWSAEFEHHHQPKKMEHHKVPPFIVLMISFSWTLHMQQDKHSLINEAEPFPMWLCTA